MALLPISKEGWLETETRGMSDPGQFTANESSRALRQLHALEEQSSPADLLDALAAARADQNRALAEVLSASKVVAELSNCDHLEPYKSVRLSADAILFRGMENPSGRKLLVALTGRKHRLLVPAAVILQRLPAAKWDVLLLRDPKLVHYREGCEGFGHTFRVLAARVMDFACPYASWSVIGTSMGGHPAVRLGLMRHGTRVVSVGGRRPSDIKRLIDGASIPSAFDAVCECVPQDRRDDILLVHAERHEVDAREARGTALLTGGTLAPIEGATNHNVFADMWEDGRLGPFLNRALSDEPVSRKALDESLKQVSGSSGHADRMGRNFGDRVLHRLRKYGLAPARS